MKYTTGTYIMNCHKKWQCAKCNQDIISGENCFVRIKEFGEEKINKKGETYRHKTYTRFHRYCAINLSDLSVYEKTLLQDTKDTLIYSHKELNYKIRQILNQYKKQKKLFYTKNITGRFQAIDKDKVYTFGQYGISDYTVFLKNGQVLFLELKGTNKYQKKSQQDFERYITSLGYKYHIIKKPDTLYYILNNNYK